MAKKVDPICGKRPFWTGKRRNKWEDCMKLNAKIREKTIEGKYSSKGLQDEKEFQLKISGILITAFILVMIIR